MSWQSDFYGSVYSTAKDLGANDTQAHLAASQASLETGYGRHVVGNNFFGVKASSTYEGPTVTANTSEGEDAVSNRMNQSFRAYDGLKASVANYMDVMASAFPDAWSAPNIAEAAKGLVNGKFGRYAKDLNYPSKIQGIAKTIGAQQKFAYAQNPENVPVPYGPNDDPLANSQQAQAVDGLSGLLNPASTQAVTSSDLPASEGWTINGVVPAPMPTVESWSAMAAAEPVQTPTNSAQPSGLLGAAPVNGFADMAAAGPVGLLSAPNISQADISRALTNVTAKSEFDPGFTAGLMGPTNPVSPTAVETTSYTPGGLLSTPDASVAASRFATPGTESRFPTVAINQDRMPMSINPATNTQSFMDAPQTEIATGINSPEHLAIQAQAEKQLAATRAAQPSGLLAANPALATPGFNQAVNPSMPSMSVPSVDPANAFAATPSATPAEQAINSIAAPSDMMRELPGFHVNQLDGNIVPDRVVAAPALNTVSIAEQPTIMGPATTEVAPVQDQQQTQQVQRAVTQTVAQPQSISIADKMKAAVNPGTFIGGLLGGITTMGGLLGNSDDRGGLSGLLGSPTPTGSFVGYGPEAAYGIYGGGFAPGSSAIASDGSHLRSMANGEVSRTNTYGATDVTKSGGGYAHDLSGWF